MSDKGTLFIYNSRELTEKPTTLLTRHLSDVVDAEHLSDFLYEALEEDCKGEAYTVADVVKAFVEHTELYCHKDFLRVADRQLTFGEAKSLFVDSNKYPKIEGVHDQVSVIDISEPSIVNSYEHIDNLNKLKGLGGVE